MTQSNLAHFLTRALIVCALVGGCGNKFSNMSDDELEKKYRECQSVKNPQPGTAIACGNIEKEYEKRNG